MTVLNVPTDAAATIAELCRAQGQRVPDIVGPPGSASRDLTWTPDLTTAEQAAITDLVSAGQSHVGISPAEWQAIKADVATCKAFLGLASPTAGQTAAATKSLIRVVAALLRS